MKLSRLNIEGKVIQAILTGLFTIGMGYLAFFYNSKLEAQKSEYAKELKIFSDSLSRISQASFNETKTIEALRIDVQITETLFDLLQNTDAIFAHYIKVHNGGLELSPTRPKYTTILSEVTSKGISNIKDYYQARPLNKAALNTYVASIPNGYYIIDDYDDPVFQGDPEAIERLKAISVKSIIVYYVGHINESLLFLQLSFKEEGVSESKSGLVKNIGIDHSHMIRSLIREFNNKYKDENILEKI